MKNWDERGKRVMDTRNETQKMIEDKMSGIIDGPIMQEPPGAESLSFAPSHYRDAPCDVLEVQGYVTDNYRDAFIKENTEGDSVRAGLTATEIAARVWCIGAAVKHLLRLGRKDGVEFELRKIENYIHRARTGEWLKDE